MNETTYNIAMFGKEYLDKAIEGIKDLTPKALWYLKWKCTIMGVMGIFPLILGTITGITAYKLTFGYIKKQKKIDEKFEFDPNDNESHIARTVIGMILTAITIICLLIFLIKLTQTITAFTPICPIDKAIEIGKGLVS